MFNSTGRPGVHKTGLLITEELGWIFREQVTDDWGIDAQIEVVDGNVPTGRLIALQIKSGKSWFDEENAEGFVYRGDPRHLEYWRGHSLPVVVVLYDPRDGTLYWQLVLEDLVERTGKGWKITIPRERQLG